MYLVYGFLLNPDTVNVFVPPTTLLYSVGNSPDPNGTMSKLLNATSGYIEFLLST